MEIKKVKDVKKLLGLISESNMTVAQELNLTKENAPGHTAFITADKLLDKIESKEYYQIGNPPKGCIAIEKSPEEGIYYIERLSVLPTERHKGLGGNLLEFSLRRIKELGGEKASIGIINENTRLKKWYEGYGFEESGIRKFEHLPFTVCFMEHGL